MLLRKRISLSTEFIKKLYIKLSVVPPCTTERYHCAPFQILLYDFSLIGRDLHSCRSFLLFTRPIMVKDKTRSLSKEFEVASIFLNISSKNSYISITFKKVIFLSVNMTTYLIDFSCRISIEIKSLLWYDTIIRKIVEQNC